MSKFLLSVLALSLFVFASCQPASAQSSTAALSGTVQDENSAVIPGAKITLTNPSTGLERTTTTNASGSFTIPLLPTGEYAVLVERDGFTRVQLTNIVLNVGDQKAVQVQLKVGDASATVEVRPDETLINVSPAVTNTIDRNFAGNLPLNGRSFQSLILLTPGITITPSAFNNQGQFSTNGQRTDTNIFSIDGVSGNTGTFAPLTTDGAAAANAGSVSQSLSGSTPGVTTFGGTNGMVAADALEEFKVQTSTYSAESGRSPGAQVSLVTRSGKNEFQGSLFEYFRNEKLDANDWFANSLGRGRSPLRQNIFGGTLGGPIYFPSFGEGDSRWYSGKNRTFFFFSYEGTRLQVPQAKSGNVPSLRLRGLAAPAIRKLLDSTPLPNGPESTLNNTICVPGPSNPACAPNGQRYSGLATHTASYSDSNTADIAGVRIDHTVSQKLSIFGRYNFATSTSISRSTGNFAQMTNAGIRARTLTVGSVWTPTVNISNDIRVNITRDSQEQGLEADSYGGAVPIQLSDLVTNLGTQGSRIQATWLLSLTGVGGIRPSLTLGNGLVNTYQRQFNIVDGVTYVRGSHTFKLGGDYRRLSPIYAPYDYGQQATFTTEASLANGTVDLLGRTAFRGVRPIFNNLSLYAQDSWKLSKRLTVDLGLRWEMNPPPGGEVRQYTVLGGDNIATATVAPAGTPMYKTQYTAFAPRFGAVWQMSDREGWERVVRGGAGIYYDTGSASAIAGASGGWPFATSIPSVPSAFPIPAASSVPPVFRTAPNADDGMIAFEPGFKLPYTVQWNFSVEQSLGKSQTFSASYVAASGRRLISKLTGNRAPTGTPRPNLNFGQLTYVTNAASSDYHSMQLQFKRRLTRGFQALVNYTWAHAIDSISSEVNTVGVLEKGNADFDVRHNFSAAVTYDLPGKGLKGFAGAILGGWSMDAIAHAQSGFPINVFFSNLTVFNDGLGVAVRPNLVPGQPLYIDDPTKPGGRRFNTAAFSTPTGTPQPQGTFGRNVLRGLPLHQLDIGLRRQFTLNEKVKLQFKAEAFNVFNHPMFFGYGTTITNTTTFGVPTQMMGRGLGGLNALYQIGGPRSIQLSMRLGF